MNNKYFLYILRNSEDKLYIGQTNDLEKRLEYHRQLKGSKFTKENMHDFRLVYFEEFKTRKEAMNRELQIKKWSRAKKEALIMRDYRKLKEV